MAALQAALAEHGAWVLFLLAVIEGPVVVLGATALGQIGAMDIRFVWFVAVVADLVGDSALYFLGRHLPDCLPRSLRPSGVRGRAESVFRTSGARILLVAKLTHFAGLPTLIAAGFARMPLARFLFWNLVGTLPKVTAIVLAGSQFWKSVLSGSTESVVATLLVAAALAGTGVMLLRKRRS